MMMMMICCNYHKSACQSSRSLECVALFFRSSNSLTLNLTVKTSLHGFTSGHHTFSNLIYIYVASLYQINYRENFRHHATDPLSEQSSRIIVWSRIWIMWRIIYACHHHHFQGLNQGWFVPGSNRQRLEMETPSLPRTSHTSPSPRLIVGCVVVWACGSHPFRKDVPTNSACLLYTSRCV